jgi:hypothetical protein
MFSRSKKELTPSPAHVRPAPPADPPAKRLPEGAEAALWAILEVVPDPRNHLALTRDPTCEVRLTPTQLAEAKAATLPPPPSAPAVVDGSDPARTVFPAPPVAPAPSPAPAVAPPPSAPPLTRRPRQVARRADVHWSEDTAEVRLPAIASPLDPHPAPDHWAQGA